MTQTPIARRRWRWQPNPILVKEVRAQMRGGRAFILLTGLLIGLGVAGYGLFLNITAQAQFGAVLLSAQIGQALFGGLAFTLLGGVCIIAPAITVGAISSERERLTYEMLLTTRLSPAQILWGKLVSALSYVALLLLAAVPLGSIVYLFGGINLRTVINVLAVIIMTAITAGMLGLWASALTTKTARAAILTYLILFLTMGGLLFSAYIWASRRMEDVPLALLTPNPVSAVASTLVPLSNPPDQFGPVPMPIMRDIAVNAIAGPAGPFGGSGINSIPGWRVLSIGLYAANDRNPQIQAQAADARSTWRTTLVIEILACLVLFWMSLHLVKPRRRWRVGWPDLLMLSITTFSVLGLGTWRGWWF